MLINSFVTYKIFTAQVKAVYADSLTVVDNEFTFMEFDPAKCEVVKRPDYWTKQLDSIKVM